MLPIYICEDNIHELKQIEHSVRVFFEIKFPDITACIYTFSNPDMLLEEIDHHKEHGIYFLDYNLNNHINGLELAQEIRKQDVVGPITFISTFEECWRLSHRYRVYAMNFISKETPDLQKQISDALVASLDYYNSLAKHVTEIDNSIINIKSGRTIHQLEKRKIIYIISSDKEHIIDVYTKRIVVHPRDTIANYINILNSEMFFQCNRNSIINLNYIDKFNTNKQLVTVVGKDFPLSKAKCKELVNTLKKRDRSKH